VPGKRDADMVGASALACCGDFLLRLAGCSAQGLGRRGSTDCVCRQGAHELEEIGADQFVGPCHDIVAPVVDRETWRRISRRARTCPGRTSIIAFDAEPLGERGIGDRSPAFEKRISRRERRRAPWRVLLTPGGWRRCCQRRRQPNSLVASELQLDREKARAIAAELMKLRGAAPPIN
jgi:hypothetical protein